MQDNQSQSWDTMETPEEFISQSQGHTSRLFERSLFGSRPPNRGRALGDSLAQNGVLEFSVTLVWTETHNFNYV